MFLTLTIIHVIIAVILIVVVLMQHGKQQGLSGAIAGGAETFFGKNKGRTIDAMLKKFTAVVAILFVVSSLALTAVAVKDANDAANDAANNTTQEQTAAEGQQESPYTLDENGNMVDSEGNVVATAEDLAKAQAEMQSEQSNDGNAENQQSDNTEATPAE